MKKISLFLVLFTSLLHAQSIIMFGSTPVVIDTIRTQMDVPWEIVYGPDNFLWVTERTGKVSRIDPIAKTKNVILDLSGTIVCYNESGLLGLALHPDFPTTPEVFMVYTYGVLLNMKERLVKYTYSGGVLSNPKILLDSIKANTSHDGSRLFFLPDKTLLMTTGEAQNGALSQDLNSLNGKVLRLNSDGTIPSDNPFTNSYVYSFGHRNAQGLTSGPSGIMYMSEHGTDANDEFQILEKGRNYGWPKVEGYCDLPYERIFCMLQKVKEPILAWSPSIAPGDLAWYENASFPECDKRMLMVTLKTKMLVAIQLNAAGTATVAENDYLQNMFGRLRSVCVGPNKEIFLATNGADASNNDPNTHSILVLRPPLPPLSIAKTNKDRAYSIYPTLVSGPIIVQCPAPSVSSRTLVIRDIWGRMIRTEKINSSEDHFDLSAFTPGAYMVSIEEEGQAVYSNKVFVLQ